MYTVSKLALSVCCLAWGASAYANTPPAVDFSISVDGNYIKAKSKVTDPDGDAVKLKWTFGDGKSSTSATPGHTYLSPGTYTVRLKASDGTDSNVALKTIKIPNEAPVADFDVTSKKSLYVKFHSNASDAEGDQIKYRWNFGDRKTSSAVNPGHTFAEPGTYKVTLSVNDGLHKSSTKIEKEITVDVNHAPVAGFDITKPKKDNTLYVKLASTATDPDNDALKYIWDFGDGAKSSASNPGHTYAEPGTYTIKQKVSDGLLSATVEKSVVVTLNHPPIPGFDLARSDGFYVKFASSATDPDGDELKYNWDFGDGKKSSAVNPGHTYAEAGVFTVKQRVGDGLETREIEQIITVTGDSADLKPKTTKLSVRIVDGYLEDAQVFVDLNRNYQWDENEPSGNTDKDGNVTFDISDELLVDEKGNRITNLKVISKSKKGAKNHVFGQETELTQDLVLSSNIFLTENDNASQGEEGENNTPVNVVSPFTTLADMAISNDDVGTLTPEVYQEHIGTIASGLGIEDAAVLTQDYNSATTASNIQALVAGEVLVRSNVLPATQESMEQFSENTMTTPESLAADISQYKENTVAAMEVINNAEGELSATVVTALEKTQAQLGSAFRVLVSGQTDEWRCGVTRDNNVFCWGDNSSGILGDPEVYNRVVDGSQGTDGYKYKHNYSATPVAVKVKDSQGNLVPLSNVKSVEAGPSHACAVTYAGEAYCWGGNYWGQLGNVPHEEEITEENNRSLYAQKVLAGTQNSKSKYLTDVDFMSLGQDHSCAAIKDGSVYCWGKNSAYQLGGDFPEYTKRPAEGIMNDSGELSARDYIKYVQIPMKVPFPDTVRKINSLIGSLWSHCALADNVDPEDKHNLYCWGNDMTGTLSRNVAQYYDDFAEKYEGKRRKSNSDSVYKRDEPWNWWFYEESGSIAPLYGQPVSHIKRLNIDSTREFNVDTAEEVEALRLSCKNHAEGFENCIYVNDEGFNVWINKECAEGDPECHRYSVFINDRTDVSMEIVNVKDLVFTSFDCTIQFVMKPEHDPWNPDEPGTYGLYGTWGTQFWMNFSMRDTLGDGEDIKKMYASTENGSLVMLTTGNRIFFQGNNRYGTGGQGDAVAVNEDVWGLVREPRGIRSFHDVQELSMNKRSICAATTTHAGDSSQVDYGLYCWGSSTFGQLGFDNGDNDFSYYDTTLLWNGEDENNEYFDKPNRMELLPKKICMFDGDDANCGNIDPANPDDEIAEIIENPIASNSQWYEPTGRVNTGKVFVDHSAQIPENCHVPANSIIVKSDFYDRVMVYAWGWSELFGEWPGTRATRIEGCASEVYAVPLPDDYDPEGEYHVELNDDWFDYATEVDALLTPDNKCFAMTSPSEGSFVSAMDCGVSIEGSVLEDDVYIYSGKTGKILRNNDVVRIDEKDIDPDSGSLELTLLMSGPGVTSQSSGTFWFDDGDETTDPQKFINGEIIELGSKINLAINEDKQVTLHVKYHDLEAVYPIVKTFDTKDEACRMNRPEETLGATYYPDRTVFRIWSPDSDNVKIDVNGDMYDLTLARVACYDHVYEYVMEGDQAGAYYKFYVNDEQVRDPYARMISVNDDYMAIVMNMEETEPDGGWAPRPAMNSRTDAVIYETHVRDFTISETSGVSEENRGRYLGMVETGTRYNDQDGGTATTGIDHLKELGITHVQLMPITDFSACSWSFSQDQANPCHNYGYDMRYFNIPADYYSSLVYTEDYAGKIKEVKTMINEFHKNGIRVILEIPYSHTYDPGYAKITGRYFYNPEAEWGDLVFNGDNSMVWSMIRDSMDYWIREYHVDGFRFDRAGGFSMENYSDWGEYLNRTYPDAGIMLFASANSNMEAEKGLVEVPQVRTGYVYQQSENAHAGVLNDRVRECLHGDQWLEGSGFLFGETRNPGWYENYDCLFDVVRGNLRTEEDAAEESNEWAVRGFGQPEQSVLFVATNDGATMRDKIAAHMDGDPDDEAVMKRIQKIQALAEGTVLLSQGVPLIYGGDEFGRTKAKAIDEGFDITNTNGAVGGANDFDWSLKLTGGWGDVNNYIAGLIKLRKAHPALRMTNVGDVLNSVIRDEETHTMNNEDPTLFSYDIDGTAAGDSWSQIKVVLSSNPDGEFEIRNADELVRVGCDLSLDIPDAHDGEFPLWGLPNTGECTTAPNVIQGPSITILAKPREE